MIANSDEKNHCWKHAITYLRSESCPHCDMAAGRAISPSFKLVLDRFGYRVFDDNGDRIGSGIGYGGGQGA